jgi:cytoskeletal protein RodZ
VTDGMAETTHIPEILRQARTVQGLDLAFMARKTGVARNHLADIEEGYAGSFHSLAYCRRAVMAYAEALGVAEQVAAHWDDRAWRLDPNGARPVGIEASSTGLLPSLDESLAARKWLMPAVGILGLILVGWLSLERLDRDPAEPTVTGVSSSPAIQTPPASGAAATVASAPPASPVSGALSQPVTGPVASPAPAVVTPPAAAPVGAAAISPTVTFRVEVERAMAEWVRRWVARDIPGYVAFYAPDFAGAAQHLGIRRQRMAQAQFIKVSVVEASYLETAPGEITVRFRQVYESDSYSSNDRKEIVWRQTPNGPKIRAERLVN